ncbi:6-carboxytetrahydropterin synthase QueD [Marinomonas transparens]|uniref:6-carboxy-5,6,7,8-tetrahydropterin synthase n=1 Tax=Marinomonas transparens TaxID=2795388 RepID=A0A934N2M5_9GAMM|nr:6-carboxytetrahydropterin synthase QueD [Marinomonas transparens]MBJ7537983.1 6-carboxytetrahydropterin synthase QueD [Marinomonas transparens]
MYRIRKSFQFCASHQLQGLPDSHPCSRLHGHNYEVVIELASGTLNSTGFVRDYRELSQFKSYLDDQLDHRHLNDVLGADNTTAERLAEHLYHWSKKRWPEVCAISVSETPKTWAEYRPC